MRKRISKDWSAFYAKVKQEDNSTLKQLVTNYEQFLTKLLQRKDAPEEEVEKFHKMLLVVQAELLARGKSPANVRNKN